MIAKDSSGNVAECRMNIYLIGESLKLIFYCWLIKSYVWIKKRQVVSDLVVYFYIKS